MYWSGGNDENKGSTAGRHIDKTMSVNDHRNMGKAVSLCMDIVEQLGVPKEEQFLRTLNAGHPGGMLPLDEHSAKTLHDSSLPANLYVADATILPRPMGNPPILTIMALAKKIASLLKKETDRQSLCRSMFVFGYSEFSAAFSVEAACLRL
jgi:hypothetical protein